MEHFYAIFGVFLAILSLIQFQALAIEKNLNHLSQLIRCQIFIQYYQKVRECPNWDISNTRTERF